SVGKSFGNAYCIYRRTKSVGKKSGKIPAHFFSLSLGEEDYIFLSHKSVSPFFLSSHLKSISHLLCNYISLLCNHLPILPSLLLESVTTAVGERHPCRSRAPLLSFESATTAVGERHCCNWRTPSLPWENTIVGMGERHHCHGRTTRSIVANMVVAYCGVGYEENMDA
ncbi:hypothetical protein V8G54_030419, partial [Vigna mungo]